VSRFPQALLPWRNPIWFQLISHKLLRLFVPWALLLMFALNVFLLSDLLYQVAFGAQLLGYLFGLLGLGTSIGGRLRLASAAGSFLVLNAAAWLAFWVWATGKATWSWRKITYKRRPLEYPAHT
jgi:hypothetical protein